MKENRGFVSQSMTYFTMISSSSHVPANDIIVSFVAKPNSILQTDHIFFIFFFSMFLNERLILYLGYFEEWSNDMDICKRKMHRDVG